MKMVLAIASVFVYFQLVTPVQMFYLYEETPNVGFVGESSKELNIITKDIIKSNRDPYSIRGTYSIPVKYGIGRRFQKGSAHPIDSHFKVLKTSTKADKSLKVQVEQSKGVDATNRPPKEQRKFLEEPSKKIEPRNYNSMTVNDFVPQNFGRDEKVLNAGVQQTKSYIKMSKNGNHHDPYLINIHKTQVSSEQKVKLNNINNQFGNNRKVENEMSTVEKGPQKMSNLEEVKSQVKSKYDQISNKKLDRRHYDAREYGNNNVNNVVSIANVADITNRPVAPTAIAVINANTEKDKYKVNVRGETPRIGSWEESIDDVRPYALFYRISQDSNKRNFISSTGNVQHFINDDDTELKSEKFIEQEVVNSVQPTIPPSTFKLRMKMKKYSNFRSH